MTRKVPVGRYAPSPTGDLHLGNLRTALLAWEHCRQLGGIFILRMEDIDTPRTVAGSSQRILEDLRWLGLDWEEGPDVGGPAGPYVQSERASIYRDALLQLARTGYLYPCTCSRKDLQSDASAPHGPEGPIYPGTCRRDQPDTHWLALLLAKPNNAMPTSVRFRVDRQSSIEFEDECFGPQRKKMPQESGDFVVLRRDGLWAYQLACAVDDALMGVTHVVRGSDLSPSAARQAAILSALNLPIPAYHHLPLVQDATGHRMSKRDGSAGLLSLKNEGLTPAQARERILSAC